MIIKQAIIEQIILETLLEITIYSTAIFLVIWLFRTLLSKWLSPALKYALWFLVLIRLCVPFTIESGVHLFTAPQEQQTVQASSAEASLPQTQASIPMLDGGAILPQESTDTQAQNAPIAQKTLSLTWQQWLLIVCALGFAAVLGASVVLTLQLNSRIRRFGCEPGVKTLALFNKIREEMHIRGRLPVLLVPDITSPALTVQPRPKLLLPDRLLYEANMQSVTFAIAHELMHYKRGDWLVCMLLLLLRAVYWFNPAMWLLLHNMRLDMESACDAMVVKRLDREQKLNYVNLLLTFGEDSTATLPLQGGTNG